MYDSLFNSAVNIQTARGVYPTDPGATLGQIAGAMTPYVPGGGPTQPVTTDDGSSSGAASGMAATMGQPLAAWITLLVVFLAIGFIGHKTGEPDQMKNLKLSGYNILYTGLSAILVIGAFKILFTRFKVPGFTPLIQAI